MSLQSTSFSVLALTYWSDRLDYQFNECVCFMCYVAVYNVHHLFELVSCCNKKQCVVSVYCTPRSLQRFKFFFHFLIVTIVAAMKSSFHVAIKKTYFGSSFSMWYLSFEKQGLSFGGTNKPHTVRSIITHRYPDDSECLIFNSLQLI